LPIYSDGGGATDASLIAVSPVPGLEATNVQDALEELSVETQTYWQQISTNVVSQSLYTYIVNNPEPEPAQIILPVNAPAGFAFRAFSVVGQFKITQNAGQQTRFADMLTTQGVNGYIESQSPGDSIYVACGIANTLWVVLSMVGNFNFI
jgi:heme/copper-type cytochrome/quinol oxidase subunit 2